MTIDLDSAKNSLIGSALGSLTKAYRRVVDKS